jgi:pseudomonalisin/xanthomonalisin
MIPRLRLFTIALIFLTMLSLAGAPRAARAERFTPPQGLLDGYARTFKLDAALRLHIAIELEPADRTLEASATAIANPASPMHRMRLSAAQFAQRFGRPAADTRALEAMFRDAGATNIYVSRNRLVVGGDLSISQAEKTFVTQYDLWQRGDRTIVAPTSALTLPVARIRAVRGVIKAFTPRLADTIERPGLPTDFRAQWYSIAKFRQAYDAVDGGGAGVRIALIEDSSDRADPKDFAKFAHASPEPSPAANIDPAHVIEQSVTPPVSEQVCGRDDKGQEPTMDIDAALTLAPAATIEVRYDEVCVRGGEATLELQRTLDEDPVADIIVLPFAIAPLYEPLSQTFGPTPIVYLEAVMRGIPIVVPSGDDGAYGIRAADVEKPAVVYPCVLAYVICAGGTSLGERNGIFDEGPWNDGTHASGGGISLEPRPPWQRASMEFSLANSVVNRMVPDIAADAAGHLFVYWHGYGSGGVGGTSESAAIVGAQLATINAAVPAERRIAGPGDLYVLAGAFPQAFHDVVGKNDRGYDDNALRPRPQPLPLGFKGVLPSPPPFVKGCLAVRPRGCDVDKGYDLVTGLGSLKERAAIDALKALQ